MPRRPVKPFTGLFYSRREPAAPTRDWPLLARRAPGFPRIFWRKDAPHGYHPQHSADGLPCPRIALIKPSALGDIVHSLPVLTACGSTIRQPTLPGLSIAFTSRCWPVTPTSTPPWPSSGRRATSPPWKRCCCYGRFLSRLRQQHFDLVIDLQGLLRSGVMTLATGAARRVGLSSARGGGLVLHRRGGSGHRADLACCRSLLAVTAALGMQDVACRFRLPVAEPARQWALATLATCPRPWLLFAVGALAHQAVAAGTFRRVGAVPRNGMGAA